MQSVSLKGLAVFLNSLSTAKQKQESLEYLSKEISQVCMNRIPPMLTFQILFQTKCSNQISLIQRNFSHHIKHVNNKKSNENRISYSSQL